MILRTFFTFVFVCLGLAALAIPALAQSSSQDIAATLAVQSVAITVSPTSVNYGTMQFGTTKSSSQLNPAITFTVTNTGNVNVVVKAYGAHATTSGGSQLWSLTPSAVTCPGSGLNNFAHGLTPSGGVENYLSTSTGGIILASGLTPTSAQTFTSKFYMPCPGSAGVGQTANTTITVFATAS